LYSFSKDSQFFLEINIKIICFTDRDPSDQAWFESVAYLGFLVTGESNHKMAASRELSILKWVCSVTFGKVDTGFNLLKIENNELS
jgi:hypothetical protein